MNIDEQETTTDVGRWEEGGGRRKEMGGATYRVFILVRRHVRSSALKKRVKTRWEAHRGKTKEAVAKAQCVPFSIALYTSIRATTTIVRTVSRIEPTRDGPPQELEMVNNGR